MPDWRHAPAYVSFPVASSESAAVDRCFAKLCICATTVDFPAGQSGSAKSTQGNVLIFSPRRVFAGENYRAKLKGDAIFLHAGCRKDTLEDRHGVYATSYSRHGASAIRRRQFEQYDAVRANRDFHRAGGVRQVFLPP
jgi:hypothetical protein